MEFNSERFGKVSYEEAEVIRFPQGLAGFPDMTRFFLYHDERIAPLTWLHSLDDPGLAFLAVDPLTFFPGYKAHVKLPRALHRQLGASSEWRMLSIVTVAPDFANSTVNLLGPLLINAKTRNGWQVILEDEELSTGHLLFSEAAAEGSASAVAI